MIAPVFAPIGIKTPKTVLVREDGTFARISQGLCYFAKMTGENATVGGASESVAAAVVAAPEPVVVAPVIESGVAPADGSLSSPETAVATPEPAETILAEPEAPAEAVEPTPEAVEAAPETTERPEPGVVEPPVYTDFKLPEGLQAVPEQIKSFTDIVGKFGVSQEDAQALMDLHGETLKSMQTQMEQHQRDVFDRMRADWRKDVDKRFGNRRDTVVNSARETVMSVFPDQAPRKEFWSLLSSSGVGDHPAMIAFLDSAGRKMRERAAPAPGLPVNGAKSGSKADKRYGPVR